MARPVWILDTQWREEWGKLFVEKYGLKALSTRKDIHGCLRDITKKRGSLDAFYLVHYSDIAEDDGLVKVLRGMADVLLFSGGGVGPNLIPRSRIEQKMEEFLLLWAKNEGSALRILKESGTPHKPYLAIEQMRVWLDRSQHDYINLVAPLDLLAITYVGGEIPLDSYNHARDKLLDLRKKQIGGMVRGRTNREISRSVQEFEESVQAFKDPQRILIPELRPEADRMAALMPYPLVHIDDDVDKGWEVVFPLLFGSKYRSAVSAEKGLDLINEMASKDDAFVVLLDLGLKWQDSNAPHVSAGLGLLRQIRARYKALPVYAFSAHNDLETYRLAMEAGATGYIPKISRALSSASDVMLAEQLREVFGRIRYDVCRFYFYGAFDSIQEGLKSGALQVPFHDDDDPKWSKRHYNLLLLLEQIIDSDFERTVRDYEYANRTLRNLLVSLCRPFEREKGSEVTTTSWRYSIVKDMRNAAAHAGRGGEEVLHNFDIRDVILFGLLILNPEAFDASFADDARKNLHRAYDTMFPQPLERAWVGRQVIKARETSFPDSRLLRKIRSNLPLNVLPSSDLRTNALMADKVNNPLIQDSDLGAQLTKPTPRSIFEVVPLPADSIQARAIEAPQQVKRSRKRRGMDSFFCEKNGSLYINFGTKFSGVKLDPKDQGQRSFFVWYLKEHILPNPHVYEPEVRAFLEKEFGTQIDVSAENKTRSTPNKTQDITSFELSLFATGGIAESEISRRAIDDLKNAFPQAVIESDRESAGIWFESSKDSKGARVIRGVRIRARRHSGTKAIYAQIEPTMKTLHYPDVYSEGNTVVVDNRIQKVGRDIALNDAQRQHLLAVGKNDDVLSYSDARRLVDTAAGNIRWLSGGHVVSTALGESGVFSIRQPHDDTRTLLTKTLQGVGVAVVAGAHGMESGVSEWKDKLQKAGIASITRPEAADAIVVVIPENCDATTLSAVRNQYRACGKAWKVVSPHPKNKDWSVLTGLATRLGLQPWTIREREPRIFFLGLDLGHESGIGSTVAAALVNHQGRLIAWTKGPNPPVKGNGAREEIAAASMMTIARALLRKDVLGADPASIRLVIHRDGRAIERVDKMLDILKDISGVDEVEWLDINKQNAPLFWLDKETVPGQHLIFDDARDGPQMWLRSSAGSKREGMYAWPLCLVPREMLTGLDTLGQEVFDLSNAPMQDYETKTKLPITTYFADGFSSTGERGVKFWGYEHIRQEWLLSSKD